MVWLADLELMTKRAESNGNMASPTDILGWNTIVMESKNFIQHIAEDPDEKERVQDFSNRLSAQERLIKGFSKRLMQQAEAAAKQQQQNGAGGVKPQDIVKAQFEQQKNAKKLQQMGVSHSTKTAQRQVSFDLDQERKDVETQAEIARENAKAAHEVVRNSMRSLSEPPEENA
jgi:hypothetical protein